MLKVQAAGLIVWLVASPAFAAETRIGAANLGARGVGNRRDLTRVDFLAPENADLEVRTKVMVRGSEDFDRDAPTLSLDRQTLPEWTVRLSRHKGAILQVGCKEHRPEV